MREEVVQLTSTVLRCHIETRRKWPVSLQRLDLKLWFWRNSGRCCSANNVIKTCCAFNQSFFNESFKLLPTSPLIFIVSRIMRSAPLRTGYPFVWSFWPVSSPLQWTEIVLLQISWVVVWSFAEDVLHTGYLKLLCDSRKFGPANVHRQQDFLWALRHPISFHHGTALFVSMTYS